MRSEFNFDNAKASPGFGKKINTEDKLWGVKLLFSCVFNIGNGNTCV